MFSILNGASVYLSIPLLDTLFQQEETASNSALIKKDNTQSWLPDFVTETVKSVSNTFHEFIFTGETEEILIRISVLILLAFLGKAVFGYLQDYYLSYVQQGVIKKIRDDAYAHLHKLPMSYFKNERTGDLISRITNDVNLVQNSFSVVFASIFREPVSLLVFMIIAISISWKLFLVSLVVVPFSGGLIGWIGIKLRTQTTMLQQQMGDITAVLQESISGVKIVKA
ncbi:MAG: ABC transporter ATP-binding protein, partial [Ignavibacteriae bacterium]|nr:ABC transporter ATP-binding protein [Ignavibacteriota bacterium]